MKFLEENVQLRGCKVAKGVTVGYRTYANDSMIRNGTTIGRYCSIGRRCTLNAASHPVSWLSSHPYVFERKMNPGAVRFRPDRALLTVGNDVWIGDNVVILSGVTIGDGAIIGAGALITKDVPPYAIYGGVPAKLIRYRFDPETIAALLDIKWWNYGDAILADMPFDDLPASITILRDRIASGAYSILEPHHVAREPRER